jgi:glyoxylase-like metal-dependent hydrolase (beta-lactamase superfamily II)
VTAARVLTSRYLQTNATVLALPGAGTVIVDSPYFPDELEDLVELAAPPVRLFATHAHYDHLLGRLAFADAPLLAGPSTTEAIRREPEKPQEDLAEEDARTYVRRDRRLHVGDVESTDEFELIPADGHTGDGYAVRFEDVVCCGDYLSDVEIPLLSWAGSLPGYLQTLDRLEVLVEDARLVVPGHGSPTDAAGALARLRDDRAYLEALEHPHQPLPPGRDTPRQREIHRANLERHVSGA